MKHKILMICCVAICLFSCNSETKDAKMESPGADSTTKMASDEKKEKEWIPVDSATCMKAMMEAGTPGEPHKMLAKSNGTWDIEMSSWMSEGGAPMVSKGKATNTMVLGGRYQQTKFTSDFGGMPYEGMGTTAYDNTEKKYVSTWMDNMSTAVMYATGTWDDASKSMTLTGTMKNPANGIDCNIRQVYKIVDDNHQVLEMYGPDMKTGKEFKMMEIKYARKK